MCKTTNRQFVLTTIFLATAACGSSSESETSAVQTNDVHSIGDLDSPPYDSAEVETQEVDDDDTQEPINPLNAAPVDSAGPHQVAYRVETVRYTPIQLMEEREIRVAVWYPTKDISGEPSNFNFGLYPVERATVFSNAEPLSDVGPVMIYSHGNFGFAEAHYTLCEHFASHGWTVIAPDHTGNTWNSFSERDTDTYLNRPQDLSASLNAVAPDAEQVAVVGHSYGGYTSFSIAGATPDLDDCDDPNNDSDFCSLMDESRRATFAKVVDARVGVIIPMAAGNSKQISGDGSGVAAIDVPVFLLTGSLDNSNSNESDGDPYWNGLNGPTDRRLNITNGGHQSFASTCLHYEVGLADGDGCAGDEYIAPEEALAIINEYVLAFARYHLTADTAQADRLNGPATTTNIELSAKN